MDAGEPLYPIVVLIDELKSEQVALRLSAVTRIGTIALALGPERTRDELLPFLQGSLDDDNSMLIALAEQLGATFVDYLGGSPHAHLLLPLLESLAAVEESSVRDKVAESIAALAPVLSAQQLEQHYVPLVQRLVASDWFASRAAAAALVAPAYPFIGAPGQAALRADFAKLCHDDTPMVRRAATRALSTLIKVLGEDEVVCGALPLYRHLLSDEQDNVRLLTADSLVLLAEVLPHADALSEVVSSLRTMVGDKSWRVRYMAADHLVPLSRAMGHDVTCTDLVLAYVHLLRDGEAEVRTAATGQLPGMAELLDRDVLLMRIVPLVQDIAADASSPLRTVLAGQVSSLAPKLGRDATIEHLLPIYLALLKDDYPDVRLNIISKLEDVNGVIGVELLSQSLLPAIVELAEDKQWRVRQAIIEYVPLLARQLGMAFFDDQFTGLCMAWLGDTVFSIREEATINLRKLTELFGVEWARRAVLPQLKEMSEHPNYLYRLTTLFALSALAEALDKPTLADAVLPIVLRLGPDPIPNIRFNVAQTLEVLALLLLAEPGPSLAHVKLFVPALLALKGDADADVRFFAQKALEALPSTAFGA